MWTKWDKFWFIWSNEVSERERVTRTHFYIAKVLFPFSYRLRSTTLPSLLLCLSFQIEVGWKLFRLLLKERKESWDKRSIRLLCRFTLNMFNQWNDRIFFIAGYSEDDFLLLHERDLIWWLSYRDESSHLKIQKLEHYSLSLRPPSLSSLNTALSCIECPPCRRQSSKGFLCKFALKSPSFFSPLLSHALRSRPEMCWLL